MSWRAEFWAAHRACVSGPHTGRSEREAAFEELTDFPRALKEFARVGGREGVKLEEQVIITSTGTERMSTLDFEMDWL